MYKECKQLVDNINKLVEPEKQLLLVRPEATKKWELYKGDVKLISSKGMGDIHIFLTGILVWLESNLDTVTVTYQVFTNGKVASEIDRIKVTYTPELLEKLKEFSVIAEKHDVAVSGFVFNEIEDVYHEGMLTVGSVWEVTVRNNNRHYFTNSANNGKWYSTETKPLPPFPNFL